MTRAAAVSERGTSRETNEDACCLRVANTARGALTMAVVCDGVGGLAHGEQASSYVVRQMTTWFEKNVLPAVLSAPIDDPLRGLDEAWDERLAQIHAHIRSCGEARGVEMGTTCTGIVAHLGRFLAVQIGDSRLYRLREGSCERITQDQTVASRMVEMGELAAEEEATHPGRHVILQAIGAGKSLQPRFTGGTYGPDDLFVLCTDGMHGCLGDDGVCGGLGSVCPPDEAQLKRACHDLVDHALKAGGTDNLTVACFCGDPLRSEEPQTVVVGGDARW